MKKLLLFLFSLFFISFIGCTLPNQGENLIKLDTPVVTLTEDLASWSENLNAKKFEISINGTLSYVENSVTSKKLNSGDELKVRALGDGKRYSNSDFSNTVTYTPLPHEHEFGEVEYTWSEDNLEVKAMRTCIHDQSHVESEIVNTKIEIIKEPNELGIGINKYTTNEFSNNSFEVQTKEIEVNYDNYFVFNLINDTYTVEKFKKNLSTVVIPSEYKGKKVTSIGDNAFEDSYDLTCIIIPNSITSIQNDAFIRCYKLVEIYNLSDLDIKIGSEDLGHIGYYSKTIHKDINEPSIITTKDRYQFIKDNNDIYCLFNYTGSDDNLILPDNMNGSTYQIYDYAFIGKFCLKSITIPQGVTKIGDCSFKGCMNLSTITMPESITSIGAEAFFVCKSLTSITIPKNVTNIGFHAFTYCYKLIEIYNLSSLEIKLGSYDHGCITENAEVVHTDLNEPSIIITKDEYQFYKNDNNTYYLFNYSGDNNNLILPDNINESTYEIKDHTFYYCSSLTSVLIPEGVTSIGRYAFYNCSSLKNIILSEKITSVDEYAFSGCNNLTIYCDEDTQITNWSDAWNSSKRPVILKKATDPNENVEQVKEINGINSSNIVKKTIDRYTDAEVDNKEVIILNGSYKLTGNLETQNLIYVEENTTAILDLNGYNINSTFEGFTIVNYGKLIINDSKGTGCVYNSSKKYKYYGHDGIRNFGELVINGGTFGDSDNIKYNANDTTYGAAVRNETNGICTINGGYFTCLDNYGKWDNNKDAYSYAIINYGEMTINNAEVYGAMNGGIAANAGNVTIYNINVNITGNASFAALATNAGKGTIVVNGGQFFKTGNDNPILNSFNGMLSWDVTDKLEASGYIINGGYFKHGDNELDLSTK